jgi:PrpF protein
LPAALAQSHCQLQDKESQNRVVRCLEPRFVAIVDGLAANQQTDIGDDGRRNYMLERSHGQATQPVAADPSVSMHAPHPAIGLTSAVALTIAAAIPGTLPHTAARQIGDGMLRLGTPAGVITTRTVPGTNGSSPTVLLHRAARRIARAELEVPIAALTAQQSSHERPPSAVPTSLKG